MQKFTLLGNQPIYSRAQIKPNIGGNLIVARASGMEFFARIADQLDESVLNIHMHVFEFDSPLHVAVFDFPKDCAKRVFDLIFFLRREYANGGQHGGMSDGASNILSVETSVKVY